METEGPLEIRVVEAVCYMDCPKHNDMFFVTFVTKFEWIRWRFIEIPVGTEMALHATISIYNGLGKPVFVHDCGGEIRRESVGIGPSASHRLFARSILISDQLSGRPISFDPWIRFDAGEKRIWNLKFDLSLQKPFPGRDSYIESVLFGLVTDQGLALREIVLTRKEGKDIRWRCLQDLQQYHEEKQEAVVDAGLPDAAALYKNLLDSFSLEELRTLCFELGVDHENFSSRKEGMVREIVEHFERTGRVEALVAYCERNRPAVEWRPGADHKE